MTSCTTNFSLEELKHLRIFISEAGYVAECYVCQSVREKIDTAIELMEIVEENRVMANG